MTRARAIGVAAAGLVLHGLLLAGAGSALPGPVRLAAAFAVLILFPGYALVALGLRAPGGAWLTPGWAFGFGVAWTSALVLLSHAAGLPFLSLLSWMLPADAALWGLVAWRAHGPAPRAPDGLPRWAVVGVLLAAALAAWHVARLGPPMGYMSDTPDHVGTLRRMLQTGELFPADAFFRDAGSLGADPRKGLWHGVVALITRLAGLDPIESWSWIGALIVPFFVFNVAALGFLCRPPAGAAVTAWAFVLTYGGTLALSPIRTMVFASRMGDQLALATTVAVLADLRAPARTTRGAAAVLGFSAVAAHVFAAIQFAIVFTALGLGLLVRDRRPGPELRRLAGTTLLVALACLPYLLFRTSQAYAPANIIHTEPQGLLYLGGPLQVVSIGQLWDWMGWAWVLVPLAWPWLWTRGRSNLAVLFLLTSSLAVALIIYDPLAVAVLQPRLGYLLMRMICLVPFAAIVAWLLPDLIAVLRASGPRSRRVGAGALLALALAVLWPAVHDATQVLANPDLIAEPERREDPRHWRTEFGWMARHLDRGCVVLSDPVTSYMVPMMTGRYVATLVDQHSSPNDSLALTRILDARDALDPYGSWSRTRGVVRRYGVQVLVLNDRFLEPPVLNYWAPQHHWFLAARARFDAHPEAFPPLYDTGDFVVYGIRRAALDTLSAPARTRPFVGAWAPRRTDADATRRASDRFPTMIGFTLAPREAAPGDSLTGVARWHAAVPAGAGAYKVTVRFDRDLPGGFAPPAFIGKPARKLVELLRHERYRFRADHQPTGGEYGVDLWTPADVVRDSFVLVVPPDVAEGAYRVQIRMLRQPNYTNLRLSDWFFDDDYYSGEPVGVLVVRRVGRTGAAAPASRPRQ